MQTLQDKIYSTGNYLNENAFPTGTIYVAKSIVYIGDL